MPVTWKVGPGLVLASLAATLVVGLAVKSPCATGDWGDGRAYERFCYTDIVPLLDTEQLTGDRLPYLDACEEAGANCDEYPVLSMYAMRSGAWISNANPGYFYVNVALLSIAATVVAASLYRLAGSRALILALAPTLAIYAFMNWDLIAVAFATVGTLAYVRRRDVWSGVLLGLGAAAKLYPALLVVPFVAGRLRERDRQGARGITLAAASAWLLVNLPFAFGGFGEWAEFFRFNSARSADWDSLWFHGCRHLTGGLYCRPVAELNVASAVLFVGATALVWRLKARREPGFARWTLGLPILIAFLLTSKVYSPQFSLWLLPWFALTLPDLRLFAAFSATEVAVFVTRFSWLGRFLGFDGWPLAAFEVALLARAVVLVWCVAAWIGRPQPGLGTTVPVEVEMRSA